MRAALLHSKKAIDTRAKSNREKLFEGASDKRNVEEKATYVVSSHLSPSELKKLVGAACLL